MALFRRRRRTMEQEVRELQAAILAVCETADFDRQENASLRTRMGLVERLVTEQHRALIETNESLAQRLARLHRSTPLPPPAPGVAAAPSYLKDLGTPQEGRGHVVEQKQTSPSSTAQGTAPAPGTAWHGIPEAGPTIPAVRAQGSSMHTEPGRDERPLATVSRIKEVDDGRPLAPVLPFAPRSPGEAAQEVRTSAEARISSSPATDRTKVGADAASSYVREADLRVGGVEGSLTYLRGVSDGLVRSAASQAASMDGIRVRQDGLEARIEEVDSSIDSRIAEAQAAALSAVEERVVTGLDEFRTAQVRMANEQARFEIAAREEIASVIDRFRLGSERDW